MKPSKVLIIGSGPIVIGQAAEFDYAGTLKACGGMVEFKLTSPSSPMLFSSNGYQLVVMPMLTTEAKQVEPEAETVETEAEATEPEVEVNEPVKPKPKKAKRSRKREPVTAK